MIHHSTRGYNDSKSRFHSTMANMLRLLVLLTDYSRRVVGMMTSEIITCGIRYHSYYNVYRRSTIVISFVVFVEHQMWSIVLEPGKLELLLIYQFSICFWQHFLRFTDSDNPFGMFKLFLAYNKQHSLISDHRTLFTKCRRTQQSINT